MPHVMFYFFVIFYMMPQCAKPLAFILQDQRKRSGTPSSPQAQVCAALALASTTGAAVAEPKRTPWVRI